MTRFPRSQMGKVWLLSMRSLGVGGTPGLLMLGLCAMTCPVARAADVPAPACVLLEAEGKVEVARKGSAAWSAAQVNATLQLGDRLRTGQLIRATLRLAEL